METNANTKLYDKIVDRAAMVRLYEQKVLNGVGSTIDEHQEISAKTLLRHDPRDPLLIRELDRVRLAQYRQNYNISSKGMIDLFSDQVSYMYQSIESVFGKVLVAERPNFRLAEDVVLNRPLYNDITLAAGWSSISVAEKKRIEALIRKGISEGLSVSEIAAQVRKGLVHDISRHQSRGLVITGLTSVSAQADQEVYKANSKAIVGYQYIAVLDSRTTPVCASRDGKIFPVEDTKNLPPAHFYCRSRTTPVFKAWDDLSKLEGLSAIRARNLEGLTKKQRDFYDGLTPARESYQTWLSRQPDSTKLKHLGDYTAVKAFNSGQLELDRFVNPNGRSIGINELRALSTDTYNVPGDTRRFKAAKEQLDAMQLGVSRPEDLVNDKKLQRTLADYYKLQAAELNGTLSLINYRGSVLGSKSAVKRRVLTNPPRDDQLKFNPVTGRYEDVRLYQPNAGVYQSAIRRVSEAEIFDTDKEFIKSFVEQLSTSLGLNERAVIADNLRVLFTRYRKDPTPWVNFKAVVQSQIKFDVMNISEAIETQIRKDSDVLKKLLQDNYIDPVLGPTQLDELHDSFISNIKKKNKWEDNVAPKIAKQLRSLFDADIAKKAPAVWARLDENSLQQFYLRFAQRLSLADSPDRDQFAVALGRDLHNLANFNGNRREWYELGLALLNNKRAKSLFEIETFGVQKRRMKSRLSGAYFGPYYDTIAYNLRIVDPRVQEYSKLTRKVELGLRVSVTSDKNRLKFREGYKTYFLDDGIFGQYDTRIPITSTSSFTDFPAEFVDKSLIEALTWASKAEYKIDPDYYDFVKKLLYFEDDRGNAKLYNELNEFRKYIASRGDSYERFKAMEWLRSSGKAFSNHPFVDHRARVYDRGLISPQSGETFRPFLNSSVEKNFSPAGFDNLQDQIGSFLGGLDDRLEGKFNSLSITGRQKIAQKWRAELVKIGNHALRSKPNDIRAILESPLVKIIDGEELSKFYRFAIETAKIDNYLGGNYSKANLDKLNSYKISLALEQDASSSGAQIIALTTRNKQLAELSNVVPTNYKKRLYDEIAAKTFRDSRFISLNQRLGLSEKDLRKAAKAQNMVTFYGAGERTGILNVEGKLAKVLNKDADTLVVKAADRDTVLNEISAQIARYERFDPETALELRQLRANVRDIFNKGQDPGDDILEQLWFLQPQTRDLVEKLSHSYERVVTPEDFKAIAKIMSEYLADEVPILKDFTRYFGRLAQDFLESAKPSDANFDWKSILKLSVRGESSRGTVLPDWLNKYFNIKPGEPITENILKRFSWYKPGSGLSEIINGIDTPDARRTGGKYLKVQVTVPTVPTPSNLLQKKLLQEKTLVDGVEVFYANKLPKAWTNVPWVNFDGKIIEQNFTQQFEERLVYRDADGNWITNILQVPQKTALNPWEELLNKDGKINDIADATRARTAFAVNGNHSNDAVIVKKFHQWGSVKGVATSTVHDAFFTNAADMLEARDALREIYAEVLNKNVIKMTLDEMKARGLPAALYDKYLDEAIDTGLIPIPGRSRINGKTLKETDVLRKQDILRKLPKGFSQDYGWYGIG